MNSPSNAISTYKHPGLLRHRGAVLIAAALLVFCFVAATPGRAFATVTTYDNMVTQTATLETYANTYIAANPGAKLNANWLVPAYIRSARYPDTLWAAYGGAVPDGFATYCATQDTATGSDVQSLRTMGSITLPNGETTDAVHMFATIDGAVFSGSSSAGGDLTGWLGDTNDLLRDVSDASGGADSADVDTAYTRAKAVFNVSGRFGPEDVRADLDGYTLAAQRLASPATTYANLLQAYMTGLTDDTRVQTFCASRLTGIALTQTAYRGAVKSDYESNAYIAQLEQFYGLTAQTNNRTGSFNVVADYLLGYMPVTLSYAAASNGTVSIAAESVEAGNGTAEGATAIPNAGYHVVSWLDAGSVQVATTAAYAPAKPATGFYEAASYTATFAENDPVTIAYTAGTGGSVAPTSEKVAPATGAATGSTAAASIGYHFVNWTNSVDSTATTDATLTQAQIDAVAKSSGAYEATTFTANFAANSYSVAFDANGGSGTMANQAIVYGASAALSSNAFTRDGYTFAGWNTATDGSGTAFTDAQSVENLSTEDGATVKLYAQWTENSASPDDSGNGADGTSGTSDSADDAVGSYIDDTSEYSDAAELAKTDDRAGIALAGCLVVLLAATGCAAGALSFKKRS